MREKYFSANRLRVLQENVSPEDMFAFLKDENIFHQLYISASVDIYEIKRHKSSNKS